MKPDTILESFQHGRLLAAVLVIVGLVLSTFDIDFGEEDQKHVLEILDTLFIAGGALVAIISKYREQWKIRKEEKQQVKDRLENLESEARNDL